jgi:hypothetical protein
MCQFNMHFYHNFILSSMKFDMLEYIKRERGTGKKAQKVATWPDSILNHICIRDIITMIFINNPLLYFYSGSSVGLGPREFLTN